MRRQRRLVCVRYGCLGQEASGSAFNTSTDDIHGASVIVDALDGTLYYYEETGGY